MFFLFPSRSRGYLWASIKKMPFQCYEKCLFLCDIVNVANFTHISTKFGKQIKILPNQGQLVTACTSLSIFNSRKSYMDYVQHL